MEDGKRLPIAFDPLSDALGIESEIEAFDPSTMVAPIADESFSEVVDADYEFARTKTMEAVLQAVESLGEIAQVARQSQKARDYEVVATLTKAVLDGNRDLLELSKARQNISGSEFKSGPQTVNNNLFVGSTDELQRFLRDNGVETNTRTLKTVETMEEGEDGGEEGTREG
jgi:hypothetical protein